MLSVFESASLPLMMSKQARPKLAGVSDNFTNRTTDWMRRRKIYQYQRLTCSV
jgi:hypothetical protein